MQYTTSPDLSQMFRTQELTVTLINLVRGMGPCLLHAYQKWFELPVLESRPLAKFVRCWFSSYMCRYSRENSHFDFRAFV